MNVYVWHDSMYLVHVIYSEASDNLDFKLRLCHIVQVYRL
jgi:hypothetical protein